MANFVTLLIIPLALFGVCQAGLVGHPVGYSVGYAPSAHAFAAPPPVGQFAAPLPVAPINVNTYSTTSHHTYSTAAPAPVVKVHSGYTPFRTYSVGPSYTKYATSGHIPGPYSGPLPYEFSAPHDAFNGWSGPSVGVNFAAPVAAVGNGGWDAPRTVVKFGRPITTTTTTYATTGAIAGPVGVAAPAALAPSQVYAATPFAGPIG
ncbi:uncharacterized protein LOC133329766, partial [Musca vetustissima]|uniref:uncharacterized protein LOC133329766 n=1 Tax=Musca vetustissima TaxID=27455 RepID=UPI002AB712FD